MRAPPVPMLGWRAAIVLATLIFPAVVDGSAQAAPRAPRAAKAATSAGQVAKLWRRLAPPIPDVPGPLRIRDAQLEPVAWSSLDRWSQDDHAAAFATFVASCRSIVRNPYPERETHKVYPALHAVCRRAVRAGALGENAARAFFEENFRPVRIAKLGDSAGFLTGYYEPIVEGSRFPTGIFHVPIYRRPPDLVPPAGARAGGGFPNTGQSRRRTSSGELVPYYDRAQIEDGALDGQHLEICWIKDETDALFIQIQGSARIRLEDGTLLRINYDSHNGYSYTPVGRILIERNLVPRDEMSMQRIREWIRSNPDGAKELRRQNRSFVFFRIVGLNDEREPIGAQGMPLAAGRSIAVDKGLHAYGTPFFIEGDLPIETARPTTAFRRLMIAQDTGSAIVGPARADLYWGAGDQAGRIAGRIKQGARFTMLVPREIDPIEAARQMPLPLPRPPPQIATQKQPKTAALRQPEPGRKPVAQVATQKQPKTAVVHQAEPGSGRKPTRTRYMRR